MLKMYEYLFPCMVDFDLSPNQIRLPENLSKVFKPNAINRFVPLNGKGEELEIIINPKPTIVYLSGDLWELTHEHSNPISQFVSLNKIVDMNDDDVRTNLCNTDLTETIEICPLKIPYVIAEEYTIIYDQIEVDMISTLSGESVKWPGIRKPI